jgi:hypothetical protein
MPMSRQTCQALGRIAIQPGVERVGIAWFQEALAGDGMRGRPVCDLQRGGAALAHIGARVVVAGLFQVASLRPPQCYRPSSVLPGHGTLRSRFAP